MAELVKVAAAKETVVFIPGHGQVVFNPKSEDKAKSHPKVPADAVDRLIKR